MTPSTSRKNQDALNDILYNLSYIKNTYNPDDIRKYALSLKDLYSGDFHHLYSEFFPIIINIFNEKEYSPDILIDNLKHIKTYVEDEFQKATKEFSKQEVSSIKKLFDHINLEVAHLNYTNKLEEDLKVARAELIAAQRYIQDTENKLKTTKNDIDAAEKKLLEANNKIKDSHTQSIAVLSIFAAIVIGVTGGLSLLGNSISSAATAPLLNLLLIIFACGLVLIDSITALLYAVSKIIGKSILAKCREEDCKCTNKEGEPLCSSPEKIRKRLPFVYWINVILVILIAITLILYILNKIYCFI